MSDILFFVGKHFYLSNYYGASVKYNGVKYKSSEAAYQAQKCANTKRIKAFAKLTPDQAKRLGRRVKMRDDWDAVKVGIMHDIVTAKFNQHPLLARRLIKTGNAYLEEGNTWGDRFWGTVDGKGLNNLGKVLMQVREEIKK